MRGGKAALTINSEQFYTTPENLCFLYGKYLQDYLHDVELCKRFARRNRGLMAKMLLERTGLESLSLVKRGGL